jgi:hypothetical protein
MIISLIIIAIALVLIIAAILLLRVPRDPSPMFADFKPFVDCDISGLTVTNTNAVVIDPSDPNVITEGLLTGGAITILPGIINLTGDLTLVAQGNLTVNGIIQFPNPPNSPVSSINLTLVSLNGTVTVAGQATINGGVAAIRNDPVVRGRNPRVRSDPGTNAGFIKIGGINIDIQGSVLGTGGGSVHAGVQGEAFLGGGSAGIAGGDGGFGGDVLLCALEAVRLASGAVVLGGDGGNGGSVESTADNNGSRAFAMGGDVSPGGEVRFVGTSREEGQQCQVFLQAGSRVAGGNGSFGGEAVATGGDANLLSGGLAQAEGGKGGQGGTVLFENCVVVVNAGVVQAGDGGNGGPATANGGNGRNGALFIPGSDGGRADADGGDGGPAGDVPVIPLPSGARAAGSPGKGGSGGEAEANPGNGGQGGVLSGGGAAGGSSETDGNDS